MVSLLQDITHLQPFYKERTEQRLGLYGEIRVLLNQSTKNESWGQKTFSNITLLEKEMTECGTNPSGSFGSCKEEGLGWQSPWRGWGT